MLVRILITKLLTVVFFSISAHAFDNPFASVAQPDMKKGLEKVRSSLWYQGIESEHKRIELSLGESKPEVQEVYYPEELIRPMDMVKSF
jgi:hypothetical protein